MQPYKNLETWPPPSVKDVAWLQESLVSRQNMLQLRIRNIERQVGRSIDKITFRLHCLGKADVTINHSSDHEGKALSGLSEELTMSRRCKVTNPTRGTEATPKPHSVSSGKDPTPPLHGTLCIPSEFRSSTWARSPSSGMPTPTVVLPSVRHALHAWTPAELHLE